MGDVARKILPILNDSDDGGWSNREEVAIWTGERVGVVGFRASPRFEWDEGGKEEGEEEVWAQRMRRALEREAREVRWVAGLGK